MVFVSLAEEAAPLTAKELAAQLAEAGVLVGVAGEKRFRLVTHYWIDDLAIENTVNIFKEALARRGEQMVKDML
jgi:threonine aldolase